MYLLLAVGNTRMFPVCVSSHLPAYNGVPPSLIGPNPTEDKAELAFTI